jgi:hypothetical protein
LGNGSPPPASTTTLPSTTTTLREPTTYAFAGDFGPVEYHDFPPPIPYQCHDDILYGHWFEFTADLGSLGLSTVTLGYCLHQVHSFLFEIRGGGFLLTNADGSLGARGTLTGSFERNVLRFYEVLHVEIDITTGTGLFTGASGAAVVDATGIRILAPGTFHQGTITGSVTVP